MKKLYEVLVGYLRECDLDRDFHQIIRVEASSKDEAFELIDNYCVDNMFDSLENDFLEDSVFAIEVL